MWLLVVVLTGSRQRRNRTRLDSLFSLSVEIAGQHVVAAIRRQRIAFLPPSGSRLPSPHSRQCQQTRRRPGGGYFAAGGGGGRPLGGALRPAPELRVPDRQGGGRGRAGLPLRAGYQVRGAPGRRDGRRPRPRGHRLPKLGTRRLLWRPHPSLFPRPGSHPVTLLWWPSKSKSFSLLCLRLGYVMFV